jgi:hypothetical protein
MNQLGKFEMLWQIGGAVVVLGLIVAMTWLFQY